MQQRQKLNEEAEHVVQQDRRRLVQELHQHERLSNQSVEATQANLAEKDPLEFAHKQRTRTCVYVEFPTGFLGL